MENQEYTGYLSQEEDILVLAYSDAEAFEIFKKANTGYDPSLPSWEVHNWFKRKFKPTGKEVRSGFQYLNFDECGGHVAAAPFEEVITRFSMIRETLEDLENNLV